MNSFFCINFVVVDNNVNDTITSKCFVRENGASKSECNFCCFWVSQESTHATCHPCVSWSCWLGYICVCVYIMCDLLLLQHWWPVHGASAAEWRQCRWHHRHWPVAAAHQLYIWRYVCTHSGGGDSSVFSCQTRDWKVAGVAGEFSSPGSTFCADSYFGIRSIPRVTAVAHKRSQSFCQKCRWQVTAKHAHTLHMWLCMKWHGAWLYGVQRTCAEMAAISCGTSHTSAVSTPLRWIFFFKCAIKS